MYCVENHFRLNRDFNQCQILFRNGKTQFIPISSLSHTTSYGQERVD